MNALTTGATGGHASAIDRLMARFEGLRSPGANIGVVLDGRVVHRRGYGVSDVEHSVAWSPDQPVRIASVTKQFTAALLLALEQEGRLHLDDDVVSHVPELGGLKARVTLRHLLTATSGLHVDEGLAWLAGKDRTSPSSLDYFLRLVARQQRPMTAPGRCFLYNDTGYRLAVLAAERATGETLNSLARTHLFEPLGMHATAFVPRGDTVIPGLASTYRVTEGGELQRYLGQGESTGDGGIVSTLDDMLVWADGLARERLPIPGLAERLASVPEIPGFGRSPYAFGLWVGEHRGLRFLGHSGGGFAYCYLLAVPERRLGVVCLGNRSDLGARALAFSIADRFLEPPLTGPPSAELQFQASEPGDVAHPAGRYANAELGFTLELSTRGDVALATLMGCPAFLRSEGGRTYRAVEGYVSLSIDASDPGCLHVALGGEAIGAFERVEPLALSRHEAARFAGLYVSDELDAVVRVAPAGEGLELWLGGGAEAQTRLELTRLGADLFAADAIALRFIRDGGGIDGLRLNHGRATGIDYRRVQSETGATA